MEMLFQYLQESFTSLLLMALALGIVLGAALQMLRRRR